MSDTQRTDVSRRQEEQNTEKLAEKRKGCGCFSGCLGLLILLVAIPICLMAAFYCYPAPFVHFACAQIEKQTGIAVTFEKVEFMTSLHANVPLNGGVDAVSGKLGLKFEGLSLKRQNHAESNFDLNIRTLLVVPKNFVLPIPLIVVANDLHGVVERAGVPEKEEKQNDFFLYFLSLRGVDINFIDSVPEKPFEAKFQIIGLTLLHAPEYPLLFGDYLCDVTGSIDSALFSVGDRDGGRQWITLRRAPLNLFAPYVPILDSIFADGSATIEIEDVSNEVQRMAKLEVRLLSDCRLKSADEILTPAIQKTLNELDNNSLPKLGELKTKIERLKTRADSIRPQADRVIGAIDRISSLLAPPDVRQEISNVTGTYNQIMGNYDEWNGKYINLVSELENLKINIVENTFNHFIESGTPIEIILHEIDGDWQFDGQATAAKLLRDNYQTLIVNHQKQIEEMLVSVNKLLTL